MKIDSLQKKITISKIESVVVVSESFELVKIQ